MRLAPTRDGVSALVWVLAAGLAAGALAVAPLPYVAAALAAGGFGYLLLRLQGRTELVVAAYWVAFVLFSTLLVQWVPPGLFILFYLAMLVGVVANSLGGGLRLEPTITWLYAAFLAVVVLSLVGSDVSMGTLIDRLVLYPFGALVLLQFRSDRGYLNVVVTAILTSLVVAVWVVFRADQADFAYRADLDVNQNIVSFYIGIGAVAALAWFLSAKWRGARVAWLGPLSVAAIGMMTYAQFLLASRGVTIALAITLLVLALRTALTDRRRLLLIVAVLAVGGASLLLPGSAGLLERFEAENTLTGGGRTAIWGAVGDELMSAGPRELLIGHGFNESSGYLSRTLGGVDSTHNAYLLIAFDFGFVGLLLFVALHLLVLFRAWRDRSARGALALGIVTFLMATGLVLSTPNDFLYWAALGTALAIVSAPVRAAASPGQPLAPR